MPVGTIHSAKELSQAYQPLLLATFTFTDGTVLRLSTHGLRALDGGFPYGQDYLPRILNQDIAAVQALSDGGIDITPTVTLSLNDGDGFLWTNYESTKGFRGARLSLTFVFWNVDANDFSSDSITKFLGICSAAQAEETTLSVTATSLLSLQQASLPVIRVQKRCPWIFPRTAAERQAAADNEDSWFWECGYSPDAAGGNARGTLNAGSPYTTCNYTREACIARGMYTQDSAARITGRFGGVQWDPPNSWRGRNYTSGKKDETGLNSPNEAKYNDPIPLVYGQAWVEPVIANVVGDANSTRMESILCYGEVESVDRVVVNDTEIPLEGPDKLFTWRLVNRGDRDGAPNPDAGYDGLGDPYGSLATIEIVVPRQLADSQSIPRVRALVKGPRIRVYSNPTTFTRAFTSNPAWILLDVLIWSGRNYSDVDLQSFVDAAAYCDQAINYKNQSGQTVSHARYQASLVLRQRQSAAEVVRGLRNLMKAVLVPNSDAGGKIRLVCKRAIAGQQPAPVAGSNDNTPVNSGYVAYRFDETNATIIRRNGKSTLRIPQRPNTELPNRVSASYQDTHNNFALDSLTVVDPDALLRNAGQEVAGSFPVEGLNNFDQARRVIATWFAEQLRGNPRGDAGGTLVFEFETTFKAVHLAIGQICLLNLPSRGIANQLVRLQRIQPTTNFETVRITATWHEDAWYADTFGQEDQPRYSGNRRNTLPRPPFPLQGQTGAPPAVANPDPLYGRERFFGMAATKDVEGDRFNFRLRAVTPCNTFPSDIRPPFVPNEGSTAPTGGSLPGNSTIWIWLCALNAAGEITAPSVATRIAIPAGTGTNTATVSGIDWDAATTQHAVFAGTDPYRPWYQGTFSGTPASVTLTALDLSLATRPMPDPEFHLLQLRAKRVRNAGVWAAEISAVTATTIQIANAYWTTNQWAGYDCSVIGGDTGFDICPMYNFRVASNTSDTLTIDTSFGPAPTVMSFGSGERWLLVMRTKPTAVTADTITEPNFDNSFAVDQADLPVGGATNASPIAITCTGHGFTTGTRVRIDYVAGNTAANGVWTITAVDANTFTLNSSSGNGAYTGGGTVRWLTGGLEADEAKGKLLRIIAGKGRGHVYKIRSNTGTAITIEGDWIDTPDTTSRFITEEPDWVRVADTSPANVAVFSPSQTPEFSLDLAGHSQRTLLIMAVPVDGGGNAAIESACQVRDTYLFRDLALPTQQYQSAMQLTVDGTLGIGSDLVARIALQATAQAKAVTATVKQAPTGAGITIKLLLGAADWMTLYISPGQTAVGATPGDLARAAPITAGSNIRLDLTGVGTTFPGADLSVHIYL